MNTSPLALTDRDFDAYLPEKASSNAFTRPRLEVKQRALAWARAVTARLAEQGFGVEVHATDEHPSLRNKRRVEAQWVFFWRDEAARDELDRLLDRARTIADVLDDPSPYTRHAFLALRIDAGSIEVCFAVHPEAKVDIDNLRARLGAGSEHLAEELAKSLHALPEQFEVRAGGESGDAMRLPCSAATPEQIAAVLARCTSENVPLWIGWRVPRATALSHAEIIDEQLEDAALALFPVYRLIAWSRDNDRIGVDGVIEDRKAEQARSHAEAVARDERWKAEQAAERERATQAARARAEEAGAGRRPVTLANLFKAAPVKEPPKEAPREPAKEPAREPMKAAPREHARDARPPSSQADSKPRGAPDRAASSRDNGRDRGGPPKGRGGVPSGSQARPTFASRPAHFAAPKREGELAWEKGARVGIISGPFAGKVGTIAEMEGTKSARVLLGLLSARLDVTNLTLLESTAPPVKTQSAPEGAAARKAP
ncbi:MAG: hypothetical protein U0441_13980 [Polyangiaceae bacterium]